MGGSRKTPASENAGKGVDERRNRERPEPEDIPEIASDLLPGNHDLVASPKAQLIQRAPFDDRFLERLPPPDALASALDPDVLELRLPCRTTSRHQRLRQLRLGGQHVISRSR